MNQFPWQVAVGVFLGTLPLITTIMLIILRRDIRRIRKEIRDARDKVEK